MHTLSTPLSKEQKHAHDEIAAVLSIVPGLGHIYKGHWEAGLLWMFLGMPFAIWIGILLGLGNRRCWSALPNLVLGGTGVGTPTTKKTAVIII